MQSKQSALIALLLLSTQSAGAAEPASTAPPAAVQTSTTPTSTAHASPVPPSFARTTTVKRPAPMHLPAAYLKSICEQAKKTYTPAPEFAHCKCTVAFELQKDGTVDHIAVNKEPVDAKGKTSPIATAALVTAVINLKLSKPANVARYPLPIEITFSGAKNRAMTCACINR